MNLSIPFLATDPAQYKESWAELGFGVEADVFDMSDLLDSDSWRRIWRTVKKIADSRTRPRSFTFHFPVNDADYVHNPRVARRLYQALDYVEEYGLNGLVLHTNQVSSVFDKPYQSRNGGRYDVKRFLDNLANKYAQKQFWIGIENVPVVGNDGTDCDPYFIAPEDVPEILPANIGITWDFCHYSYSVYLVGSTPQSPKVYSDLLPRRDLDYFDFLKLGTQIKHFHFGAFEHLPIARGLPRCEEGLAPWAGTLPESVYKKAIQLIATEFPWAFTTLEIRETDYRDRRIVFEVARWCSAVQTSNLNQ
jgi:hypothetical protein